MPVPNQRFPGTRSRSIIKKPVQPALWRLGFNILPLIAIPKKSGMRNELFSHAAIVDF